jgi:death-on-curing protein
VKEPFWLQSSLILLVQKMLIKEHGGLSGLRDEPALSSALSRPINLYLYDKPDLYDLAAAYAYGLAKNHPFLDGNKRIAFMAMYIFLERNGKAFTVPEPEAALVMKQLAAGEVDEKGLAVYLRKADSHKNLQ